MEISAAERAAMRGDPMPTGQNWRGVAEWIAFTTLYRDYRAGHIDRQTASDYKVKLVAALNGAEGSLNFEKKCWESAGTRYKATETAKNEYRKNRTLENADKLVAALDGLEEN